MWLNFILRSIFQKAPILLAMLAWLMQLSVFITPILQKHPELGFGVCEELSVVIDQSNAHQTAHTEPHHSMQMHAKPIPDQKLMHHAEAFCKFCLVFGHSFDPVLLACIIVLLALLFVQRCRAISLYAFKLHVKLRFFLFQNRAPPQAAVFTRFAVI